ncbi:trypsin-5-like [Epargyreus clarus]|uniref:trypsin-5-like n=1 Tax=Epargyreus clarus TaxID=520877 RepID=UPI003C2B84CC
MRCQVRFLFALLAIYVKGESDEDTRESEDNDIEFGEYNTTSNYTQVSSTDPDHDLESGEHIGASVTQVYKHPYAASLLKNNSYECSAIILNTYWTLTLSKCFDTNIISSYVTHKYLGNYTLRVGSSYNHKGGDVHKIKMLINNFDLKVSAVKLQSPLEFGSRIQAIRLPAQDDDVTLGYLASIVAWMPSGHIRVVNIPVIDPSICEPTTKLLPGHYICVGGVQDPNRHFCRRDNGGAVIQNNTLVAISAFLHKCALYTKTHAFPKVSSFARWLDSTIWDENNRPTTTVPTTTRLTTTIMVNATTDHVPYFIDPSKFMLTLPFDPVNVPLEPAEDNSVIPRMSLYESYLQNIARSKTSTTLDPNAMEERRAWLKKFGKDVMMMPQYYRNNMNEAFDYE